MSRAFFLPQVQPSSTEAVYAGIVKSLHDQLRWPITPRRIDSLAYIHDKKSYTARVGELENQNQRYTILAILESNCYIIFTRAPSGGSGITIMVDKSEVTSIEEFAGSSVAAA